MNLTMIEVPEPSSVMISSCHSCGKEFINIEKGDVVKIGAPKRQTLFGYTTTTNKLVLCSGCVQTLAEECREFLVHKLLGVL